MGLRGWRTNCRLPVSLSRFSYWSPQASRSDGAGAGVAVRCNGWSHEVGVAVRAVGVAMWWVGCGNLTSP